MVPLQKHHVSICWLPSKIDFGLFIYFGEMLKRNFKRWDVYFMKESSSFNKHLLNAFWDLGEVRILFIPFA